MKGKLCTTSCMKFYCALKCIFMLEAQASSLSQYIALFIAGHTPKGSILWNQH